MSSTVHSGDVFKPAFTFAHRLQWLLLSAMSGQNVQTAIPTANAHENSWIELSLRVQLMRREIPANGTFKSPYENARGI